MSPLDIFAWVVLLILVASALAMFFIAGYLPGHIAKSRGHPWAQAVTVAGWVTLIFGFVLWPVVLIWAYVLQAIATGQTQTSGAAVTPTAIQSAPFVVRVRLDNSDFASSLPAGATGTAAIFTEHIKPAHVIRQVLLRHIAILNYINPF